MKKTISIVLTVCLLLTVVPLGTLPVSAETSGDYTYTVSNGEATITEYSGEGSAVTIPSTLGGYPVTSIGNEAFCGCSNLTSVTIPNGVMSIGGSAFRYCSGLTSVTIGDSVTSVGEYAFMGCSRLTSVTIPGSVTSIGDSAFYDCRSLSEVTIGDGVTSIGDYAFYACYDLTSVTIGDGVANIGGGAFSFCSSLTSITIPDSVMSIGDSAFLYCRALTSVTIPDSVTRIGEDAFRECNSLTSVYITVLAAWCAIDFANSASNPLHYADALYVNGEKINGLVIPDGVTVIPVYAFSCNHITSVTIPDSVTSIGDRAFYDCSSLTSVTIGDGVTSIGDWAFRYCRSLTSVTIPGSVTSIGDSAFYDCRSLSEVTIGDGVTSIGDSAFYDCRSLNDVRYTGTETDKTEISISSNNVPLISATWHYDVCLVGAEHIYSTCGVTDCIVCGKTGASLCIYSGECDAFCNRCSASRTTPSVIHTYGEDEVECTVCGNVRQVSAVFSVSHKEDNGALALIITFNNEVLTENVDYMLSYSGGGSTVTITGIHRYDGVTQVVNCDILKQSIANAQVTVSNCSYTGRPVYPTVNVYMDDVQLTKGRDYELQYFDNTKVGTGVVVVVGKGKYTGCTTETFTIEEFSYTSTTKTFYHFQNDSATTNADKIYFQFGAIKSYTIKNSKGDAVESHSYSAPGATSLYVDFSDLPTGTYTIQCVTQSSSGEMKLVQDADGSVGYRWVGYYTGYPSTATYTIHYSQKPIAPPATIEPTEIVAELPTAIDPWTWLLSVSGQSTSCNLDNIHWNSEDSTVAEIENGILTFKKAGRVVVTATVNNLTATWEIETESLSLSSKAQIVNYDPDTHQVMLLYDGCILQENTDYILHRQAKGSCDIITVEGINLFSGKITGYFYCDTGYPCSVEEISVVTPTVKQEYLENYESLDLTGAKISAKLSNGESVEIALTKDMVSTFDNTKIGPQTLTVTYGRATTSFTVTVRKKTLTSIAVTTKPTEILYNELFGSFSALGGAKLTLYYNNGTQEVVDWWGDGISGYNPTIPGIQTLTITYENVSTTLDFDVTIYYYITRCEAMLEEPKVGKAIPEEVCFEIQTTPVGAENQYGWGNYFWVVSDDGINYRMPGTDAVFEEGKYYALLLWMAGGWQCWDENTEFLLNGQSWDYWGYWVEDGGIPIVFADSAGESYNERTPIVFGPLKKQLTSIALTKKPNKLTYTEGETFDATGLVVTAYYNNGTSADITDYTISGDISTPGTKTITVSYGGFSDTFDVVVEAKKDGWVLEGSEWFYYLGGVKATGWQYVNDNWYYLNDAGVMQTGWLYVNNTWYYLNAGGAMQTGWLHVNNTWYYLNKGGAMTTGWQYIGGTYYYMNAGGAMQTGWLNLGGTWYYMNAGGAMTTGWQYIGGTWYYMKASGAMTTGWQYIGSTWYYMNAGGAMQTGWQRIGGVWYYFYNSGAMATNCWIGGYWINAGGVWVA